MVVKRKQLRRHGSPTWNALVKAWNLLKPGYTIRIGRGDSLFWFGSWHPQGPLCNLVPYVHISDTQLKVRDVWRDGEWRLEVLMTVVTEEVKTRLENFFVWLHNDVEDLLVWKCSQVGKYIVASGYAWLQHNLVTDFSNGFGMWK